MANGEEAERQCILFDQIQAAREKRRSKPQPWIIRKFAVGLTIGIVGYTTYVYVVRLCVPMILRESKAYGSRVIGVIFLAVFSVLLLMFSWTYAKLVLTQPGFARDHLPKSERPQFPMNQHHESVEAIPAPEVSLVVEEPLPTHRPSSQPIIEQSDEAKQPARRSSNAKAVPKPQVLPKPGRSHTRQSTRTTWTSHESRPETTRALSETGTSIKVEESVITPPPPAAVRTTKSEQTASSRTLAETSPNYRYARRPPLKSILLPEHRYCARDQIVKPFRAHHCRACGTCILKYDHHCPWVGQCVGARNQKFFVNFLEWSAPFCVWIFVSTLVLNVIAGKKSEVQFDPQLIVIIVLAGVFGTFTVMMLLNNIRLVLLNQTTVESMQARYMKQRDIIRLSNLHPWHDISGKRHTIRQWDEEWGELDTEGNMWWLESARANWEDVMGPNFWHWILPIGRSASDGMAYVRNPRFDESGRWRPRKEWPAELQ